MATPLIVAWILGLTATLCIGFVIGRFTVIYVYVEMVEGCKLIARWDARVARFLRRQEVSPPPDPLGAAAARLLGALRRWFSPSNQALTAVRYMWALSPLHMPSMLRRPAGGAA